jgi:thiosulfate/3-mercaptopyruvate sulfurtransferase
MSSTSHAQPLVSTAWVADRLGDPRLHVIHVSVEPEAYRAAHLPAAAFSDLHVDLAKPGRRPETGAAERHYLVPTREETAAVLARWGVREGDEIVFYDDQGQNRHAIRGYWLLRLYRFAPERLHVMNGGLPLWLAEGRPVTADMPAGGVAGSPPAVATPAASPSAAVPSPAAIAEANALLGDRDDSLIATADEILAWSRESAAPGGPARILDVRRADEYVGLEVQSARGGHVPGARLRPFTDLLLPDNRIRPAAEAISLLRATGVYPADVRATYCQGGVRAALAWFVLHELAGLPEVRNYAGSWEEWGNNPDLPIDK